MEPGQLNVVLRVVLRSVDRTLTGDEVNDLRDRIYAAVHAGSPAPLALGLTT
jgi:phenylalanyl-tRNA synthetase alpha chain